jgi:hypothetical protein
MLFGQLSQGSRKLPALRSRGAMMLDGYIPGALCIASNTTSTTFLRLLRQSRTAVMHWLKTNNHAEPTPHLTEMSHMFLTLCKNVGAKERGSRDGELTTSSQASVASAIQHIK